MPSSDSRSDRPAGGGRTAPQPGVARWMIGVVAAFFVVYTITVLATGEPAFLIPVVILALLALGYAVVQRMISRNLVARHGSIDAAMAAGDEPVPSAHLVPDNSTPVGDTSEAHDEISPHDIPKDAPERGAAEAQAATEGGTTSGHADPARRTGRFDREEQKAADPATRSR